MKGRGQHLLNEELHNLCYSSSTVKKKSKAVPLHAMEAHGARGGVAPTHS
jgi:hypothetical protein